VPLYPSIERVNEADVAVPIDEQDEATAAGEDANYEEEEKLDIDHEVSREEEQYSIESSSLHPRCQYSVSVTCATSCSSAAIAVSMEEATVLDDDGCGIPETNAIQDGDEGEDAAANSAASAAACAAAVDDVHDMAVAKRTAYEGGGGRWGTTSARDNGDGNYSRGFDDGADQETAVVVEITENDVHPSDLSYSNAVQAELVGQDFSHRHAAKTTGRAASEDAALHQIDQQDTNHVTATHAYASADAATREISSTAEATVIDSAPLHQLVQSGDWKYTEEAQVLEDMSASHPTLVTDGKPAAVESDPSENYHQQENLAGVAVADQEAEVVGIQLEEDVHPLEFVHRNDAEAELVGTDYSVGVAIPSNAATAQPALSSSTQDGEAPTARQVTMIPSGGQACEVQETSEVHAILVHRDYEDLSALSSDAVATLPSASEPHPMGTSTGKTLDDEDDWPGASTTPAWLRDTPPRQPFGSASTPQHTAASGSGRSDRAASSETRSQNSITLGTVRITSRGRSDSFYGAINLYTNARPSPVRDRSRPTWPEAQVT